MDVGRVRRGVGGISANLLRSEPCVLADLAEKGQPCSAALLGRKQLSFSIVFNHSLNSPCSFVPHTSDFDIQSSTARPTQHNGAFTDRDTMSAPKLIPVVDDVRREQDHSDESPDDTSGGSAFSCIGSGSSFFPRQRRAHCTGSEPRWDPPSTDERVHDFRTSPPS